jgi:outer membrane scaffolding protein for murein synthesis (MipA/OmpV family)
MFAEGSAPPTANSGDTAWILVSAALVLLMTVPALALFYGGMSRKKNVLSTVYYSFSAAIVVSIMWVAFQYSMAFGGKDEESISGRAAYKVGDEFALKFKGLVIYKVTERVNIIGLYELEKVSDDIKESPVVEKGSAGTAILMASYRF